MDGALILSPWDQAPFFQPVRETVYNLAGTAFSSVAKADPQRVGLIFSSYQGTDCFISTTPGTVVHGIHLANTIWPYMLLHKDVGPLVQAEWFAMGNGAPAVLSVFEILLAKWPGQS